MPSGDCMKYWPGSNIVKSTNNAFNWRKRVPTVAKAIVEYQTKSRSGTRGGENTVNKHHEIIGVLLR